jgi:hypothetical protein
MGRGGLCCSPTSATRTAQPIFTNTMNALASA